MLAVIMSGCATSTSQINDEGEFLGVVENKEKDLDNDYGTEAEDIGVDEKLALDVANAVIKHKWSNIDKDILKNTKYIVYEVKDRDAFVVCRWYPDRMGGDYNVAISKKDGSIIKLWIGE